MNDVVFIGVVQRFYIQNGSKKGMWDCLPISPTFSYTLHMVLIVSCGRFLYLVFSSTFIKM